MEVKFGPNSVDEPNLLYKLQNKIKVFNTNDPLQNRGYNLVTTSSKYGVVFIGIPDGTLAVYYLNQLIDKECEPMYMAIQLQEKPTYIAVSCDQELLAVIGVQLLCVYKISDFQNQNVAPVLTLETQVNSSNFVSAMQWNPCIPDSLAIAFYDGTLITYQLSTVQIKKVQSKARCICWSPKGKQLVTGNSDGSLCQYKPDLTLAKTLPAPNLFEGSPVEALALHWISTFQFAVVYKNAMDNSRPAVAIVNASKTGQHECLNYEDVCFSLGNNRPWYYYLQGLVQWNVILASSSNSIEIATVGSSDGANWAQWCQTDEGRPELPLTDKKIENYPVGLCIDTCALHQLPWGENEILPHMPLLLLVSQTGLLTLFNIVNLNKQAPQLCSPPQQLILPAAALTNSLHDDSPQQPAVAPEQPIILQPKELQVDAIPLSVQPAQAVIHANLPANITSTQSLQQQQQPIGSQFSSADTLSPQSELNGVLHQSQRAIEVNHINVPETPTIAQIQENAALKAEQERLSKIKANEELKDMLIKEVNDFQVDFYNFMLKTRVAQTKFQRDIESININFNQNSMHADQLKKECPLDDLRTAVIQLKLELVRTCALVAEARTHTDAKELQQWTQADPLTTKRVASVKKLSYYVETQLEQAQKSLNLKWKELESEDFQYNKPGQRMIRPRLDDVYQPLVRQQEILGRQQAVLRTLRNTIEDCEFAPISKSTSLLRSTPFKNKDPLSKLTKNILNMSIEPQNKPKESLLTTHKIDALRDMLSNHRIVKIKPVNVELRQHLAMIRKKYEASMKEEEVSPAYVEQTSIESELAALTPDPVTTKPLLNITRVEPVAGSVKTVPAMTPPFTPVSSAKPISSFGTIARNLFAYESKDEITKPQIQPVIQKQQQPTKPAQVLGFAPFNSTTASAATKSVLKDLLQNKSQANNIDVKNNTSTFMGQNICSPSSFSNKTVSPGVLPTSNIFAAKPVSDNNNMFYKFQPQVFTPETKPQILLSPKSNETGEPESAQAVKPFEVQKAEIPVAKAFVLSASGTSNVPDVLKSHQQDMPITDDKISLKETIKSDRMIETVPEAEKGISPKIEEPKTQSVERSDNDSFQSSSSKASSIFAAANMAVPTAPSAQPIAVPVAISPLVPKLHPEVIRKTPSIPDLTVSKSTVSDAATKSSSSSTFVSTALLESITTLPTDSKSNTSTLSILGSAHKVSSSNSVSLDTAQSALLDESSKPSIFSTPTPASSNPTTAVFKTVTPQPKSSISELNTQTSAFTSPPISETSLSSTEPSASIFNSAKSSVFSTNTTTTAASIFASATTTTASIFGTTPTTKATSLFGGTTGQTSVFGTNTSTNQSIFTAAATQESVFETTTPTTQPSVFGAPQTTQTSIFGTPEQTTQSSIFGTPTQTTQSSVFGTPTETTQSSVFGTPTQTTQSSVFGTPTQTTPASVFGNANNGQGSVFGASPQTTQSPLFGTTTTSDPSGSLFGGTEANMFASASISTTNGSQNTSGSIFGKSASPGSVFGNNGTNIFGGKTAFGQPNTTTASIFGGGTPFAQSPANNFWTGTNASAGPGFGSSSFGQQGTTQASSIFGGNSGGSFSTTQPAGQSFASPQQSTTFAGGENTPSVFSTPQPQSGSAFGGSPVFGGISVFGQSASYSSPTGGGFSSFGGFNKSPTSGFGAPASFGGAPAFGGSAFGGGLTPSSYGGGASPTPSFNQTQSNARFESLATQNTLTFGNLAQQSGQPQQQAPAFNQSPVFTGWRG